MTQINFIQIVTMWNKINELSRENLSQQQIAVKLGIHRDTVRRYQMMSETEFNEHLRREARRHPCKLDPYRDFIVDQLNAAPFLSAAQIFDHLKEHFPDLPYMTERTVFNAVRRIREEEDIEKVSMPRRQYAHVPECDWGEQAQVDYGEQWMKTAKGRQVKVYFMAMEDDKACYKFVYFQNVPFTAKTTVYAHHLAFQYFGGMPRKVIYDQDRKMLSSENFGDYLMTEEFASYVAAAGFEPVFCMAADPQSKGRIERTVRYIKENFLRGRVYVNIISLNEEALGWLERTGNRKKHSVRQIIPAEVFKEEQKHLLPYTVQLDEPESEAREYTVRKDNTLMYRSNTYSLPMGTYTGPGSKVLVIKNVDLNELEIYDPKDFSLITRHQISSLKGMHITKEGHATGRSRELLESEKRLRSFFGQWADDSVLSTLLEAIRKDRPRYYPKTVLAMDHIFTRMDKTVAEKVLRDCLQHKVYNANRMAEAAEKAQKDAGSMPPRAVPPALPGGLNQDDITPPRRNMSDYDDIIEGGTK